MPIESDRLLLIASALTGAAREGAGDPEEVVRRAIEIADTALRRLAEKDVAATPVILNVSPLAALAFESPADAPT